MSHDFAVFTDEQARSFFELAFTANQHLRRFSRSTESAAGRTWWQERATAAETGREAEMFRYFAGCYTYLDPDEANRVVWRVITNASPRRTTDAVFAERRQRNG